MEKAIEIKRRAQRCIQNGDLDGALREYEKLVGADDSDPYHFVLLADLLFKKGDQGGAAMRYLAAVAAYEKAGLYKNGIAVCKKMMRLSLSQAQVLKHLANLHGLDGLASESALYYVQYAELMVRAQSPAEAAVALRKAFDASQENVKVLEQLAETLISSGEEKEAAATLREAARHWHARGAEADAKRCSERARKLDPLGTAEPKNATRSPAEPESVPPEPSAEEPEPAADEAIGAQAEERGDEEESAPLPEALGGEVEGLERRDGFQAPAAPRAESGEFERARAFVAPALATPGAPSASARAASAPEPEPEPEPVGEEPVEIASAGPPADDRTPPPAAPQAAGPQGMARVEALLAEAQAQFRAGDRERASRSLASAAQAYESLGRLESAATIYRSLGRGAGASLEVMQAWLANCERRGEATEAAQVACELGDRSLNDGDEPRARGWFEKAVSLDGSNETARRRLQRLGGGKSAPPPTAMAPTPAPADAGGEMGRVEVAVGRGEAVTFDLSGLLAEFQRGVESQLAGDAQSHYDLGMTYREMGLLDQAIESFRVSQGEPRLTARSLEMVGRCLADQGRTAEAEAELERALATPGLDSVGAAELRYQMGVLRMACGDAAGALAHLEFVAQELPGFEDVDARLAELRQTLGKAA